jgi:hypothetical protein
MSEIPGDLLDDDDLYEAEIMRVDHTGACWRRE